MKRKRDGGLDEARAKARQLGEDLHRCAAEIKGLRDRVLALPAYKRARRKADATDSEAAYGVLLADPAFAIGGRLRTALEMLGDVHVCVDDLRMVGRLTEAEARRLSAAETRKGKRIDRELLKARTRRAAKDVSVRSALLDLAGRCRQAQKTVAELEAVC